MTVDLNVIFPLGEEVEEAEALLRGWTDRAAAKKVLDIVSSIMKSSLEKDRQLEDALKQKSHYQKKVTAFYSF